MNVSPTDVTSVHCLPLPASASQTDCGLSSLRNESVGYKKPSSDTVSSEHSGLHRAARRQYDLWPCRSEIGGSGVLGIAVGKLIQGQEFKPIIPSL